MGSIFLFGAFDAGKPRFELFSIGVTLQAFAYFLFRQYRLGINRAYYYDDLLRHVEEHRLLITLVKEKDLHKYLPHFLIYFDQTKLSAPAIQDDPSSTILAKMIGTLGKPGEEKKEDK